MEICNKAFIGHVPCVTVNTQKLIIQEKLCFFLIFSYFSLVVIINRQEIITLYIHFIRNVSICYRVSDERFLTSNTSHIILQQINTNGAHKIFGQHSKNAYKTLRNWNREEIKHCAMNRDTQCAPNDPRAWEKWEKLFGLLCHCCLLNSEWWVVCVVLSVETYGIFIKNLAFFSFSYFGLVSNDRAKDKTLFISLTFIFCFFPTLPNYDLVL